MARLAGESGGGVPKVMGAVLEKIDTHTKCTPPGGTKEGLSSHSAEERG
jgi:hypothetical protein